MSPGPLRDLRLALRSARATTNRLSRARQALTLTDSERATLTLDWMNARLLESSLERMWAREMAADYREVRHG